MRPSALLPALAAVLLAFLPGCGGGNKQQDGPGDKDGSPIKVSAEQLAKDFATDGKTAVKKYGVKILEVEGTIVRITPAEGTVSLEGTKPVVCKLKANGDRVAMLSTGQKVKVVGRITSTSDVAGVTLGECELSELTPSTLITISAKDLAAAFAKDKAAAEKKYKGKEMIVTGKVADKEAEGNTRIVSLEGVGDLSIRGFVESKADFERIKKGDDVRVRGVFELISAERFLILRDCYVLTK